MQAIFRVNASAQVGGGHVVRCWTLARALARLGWRCGFAVSPETPATAGFAMTGPHRIEILDNVGDEAAALVAAWPSGADLLVIDHFGSESGYERGFMPWAKRVMVIDDIVSRPHDCDLLLNQNMVEDIAPIRAMVPPRCRILTGPSVALVRPEFRERRAQSLARRSTSRGVGSVLVMMGMTDPLNITGAVLDALAQTAASRIDVVIGTAVPHLRALRDQARGMAQSVAIHTGVDAKTASDLMASADLAIGAPGISAWERCVLGLPSLLISWADNQRANARGLNREGACQWLGEWPNIPLRVISDAVVELSNDSIQLAAMSCAAANINDGSSTERVRREVNDLLKSSR